MILQKIENFKSFKNIIVISGPSGVGKGAVCRMLIERNNNMCLSVSATTRSPRSGEIDGVHYFFKSKIKFEEMIKNEEFLEWAKYGENYYGTPFSYVISKISQGFLIVLEIETKGAFNVKKFFPLATFIFISPPNLLVLKQRLISRNTDSFSEIEKRIEIAKKELDLIGEYDYNVINQDVCCTVQEIEKIIGELVL